MYLRDGIDPNLCVMTYSWPHYVPIPVATPPPMRPYRLFRFEEMSVHTSHTEARGSQYQPGALPVLFVHGNAGHYAQARSLGKEIHTLIAKDHPSSEVQKYVAMYTVDFLEEINFVHGDILTQQVSFVLQCLKEVRRIHHGLRVIVVGHSMGGVLASYASYVQPDHFHVLLTLSSPHRVMPVYIDPASCTFTVDSGE